MYRLLYYCIYEYCMWESRCKQRSLRKDGRAVILMKMAGVCENSLLLYRIEEKNRLTSYDFVRKYL